MILLNLDPSNAVVTGYGPNDTVICLCDATIGAFEISLPEADGVENVTFIFIRKDTTENAITIKGRNGQNINGAESIELNEHAIVIPANNSYYDLSTFSSFRTSSLLIKEGIEEPPTPPDGYIRLYSDRAHGNDLFFKFDDGSIYLLNFDPNDYALVGHTHDALYAALSDVAWLSVAESGSAAIGTLGGNLALGANTISGDGAADKGIGVGSTGIPTVTATAIASGDTRTVLRLYDDTAFEEGDGAGINLYGKIDDDGTYAMFGGIKVSKENEISGDNSASFYIQSRKQGSDPANALRLDSDQNGYIKNKLMVGSLTETPQNQLSVYKDANESVFLSLGNSNIGQNGVRIGLDNFSGAGAFYDTNYVAGGHVFRCATWAPDAYEAIMKLFWSPEEEWPKAWFYGDVKITQGNLEVYGEIYTKPLTDISSSCEVVGWSSFTEKKIYYRKVGKEATVYFHIKGTADPLVNTAYIYNIPVPISGTFRVAYNNCFGRDSTGVLANGAIAMVEIQSSLFSRIRFIKDYTIPPWPTSGDKEVYGSVTFLDIRILT